MMRYTIIANSTEVSSTASSVAARRAELDRREDASERLHDPVEVAVRPLRELSADGLGPREQEEADDQDDLHDDDTIDVDEVSDHRVAST